MAAQCPCGLCRWSGYAAAVSSLNRTQLDALVEEATVDRYSEDEQLTGLYTMILAEDRIVATCHRGRQRQAIATLDLPLPDPPQDDSQWIEAYRHWGG
jgi:hypothetical protein